jgi:ribonuclease PH
MDQSDSTQLQLRVGVFGPQHSTGSSTAEYGSSKVLCSVRGPLPLTTEFRNGFGKVQCMVSRSPFASRVRRSGAHHSQLAVFGRLAKGSGLEFVGSEEWELSEALQSIAEKVVRLERYPQLLFDVTFEIVASGDDELTDLTACVAAFSAAVANARLEVMDLVGGSVVTVQENGTCVVNAPSNSRYITPVAQPETSPQSSSRILVVSLLHRDEVVFFSARGAAVGLDWTQRAIQMALAANKERLLPVFHAAIQA